MNERSEADRLAAALELPGEAEGSGTPTGEFADLVQLSRRLTQAAPPSLAEAQRQAMRRRVLASRAAEAPHRLLSPAWPRWQRRLALAAVIVALAVLTGGGALRASAESVPGQPLYGLKRAQEQTHVALAFSDAAKATAYADAAAHRIQEVHQLTGHGDPQVVRALASQAAQDIGHAGQFAGRPDTGLQRRVQALQREQQALPVPSASPNATPLAGVTVSPQLESTPTASPAPGPAPSPTQLPPSTVPTASPAPTPSPIPGPTPSASRTAPTASATPVPSPAPTLSSTPPAPIISPTPGTAPGPTPSPSRTAPTASATPVPSPAPTLSSTPPAPTVSPAPAALAGSTSAPSVATAPAAPPLASPLASPRATATNRSSPTTSAREQSTTRRVRSSGQIPPAQTPGVTSTPLPR